MKTPSATRWIEIVYALALMVGASDVAAQGKAAPSAKPARERTDSVASAKAPMHSCPMEGAGPIADVQVENTTDGAVIRLKAKSPSDVQRIQHMAAMMAEHMSGEGMKGMHGGMQHGGMKHDGMQHGGMQRGGTHGAGRSAPQSTPRSGSPDAR